MVVMMRTLSKIMTMVVTMTLTMIMVMMKMNRRVLLPNKTRLQRHLKMQSKQPEDTHLFPMMKPNR